MVKLVRPSTSTKANSLTLTTSHNHPPWVALLYIYFSIITSHIGSIISGPHVRYLYSLASFLLLKGLRCSKLENWEKFYSKSLPDRLAEICPTFFPGGNRRLIVVDLLTEGWFPPPCGWLTMFIATPLTLGYFVGFVFIK